MSKSVQWIEYKGKRILFNNFAGLAGAEYMAAVEASQQELQKLPDGTHYLSLTDTTHVTLTAEMSAKGREVMAMVKKKKLVPVAAIVGISGIAATVAKLVQPTMYFAKTLEEAKEWLVAQPK